MSQAVPRLLPLGASAWTLVLGDRIDPAIHRQVMALTGAVERRRIAGVRELVPAYAALTVFCDPLADAAAIGRELERVASLPLPPVESSPGARHTIPTRYDGPDLDLVAERTGLTRAEVVQRHAGREYTVYLLGFAPGFAYLGELDPVLRLPRRESPRVRVPAGSVAIAGGQTAVYPLTTPGGWHLLGATDLALFDRTREPAGPAPSRRPGAIRAGSVIRIIKAPPHAVVQDLGFPAGRAFGLPESGAMDRRALQLANLSLGNQPGAAGLEWSLGPLVIRAEESHRLTAVGPREVRLDGRPVESLVGVAVPAGSEVSLIPGRNPMFCYLAVAGGLATEPVLGSRSTYLPGGIGGFEGRRLKAEDRLPVARAGPPLPAEIAGRLSQLLAATRDPVTPVLRVTPGPQWDLFDEEIRQRLLDSPWLVDRAADRAGYRLTGPAIPPRNPATLPSEAACPGAIQVPDNGQPIVLMPDGPTVGGYPKLAVVVRTDLDRLAQCAPGTELRFRRIGLDEARAVLRDEADALGALVASES